MKFAIHSEEEKKHLLVNRILGCSKDSLVRERPGGGGAEFLYPDDGWMDDGLI